ncbi:MAG: TM2 domain-containing protein [Ignavibacteriales bacterium]|nr:TM2 domain-containing protein [Ignavibacteriales bacterium]MCF8305419.1 TM2 domain-containing protein [Ignavibacteriales bacterium]MCF8316102.1 TM2 domain-containing protein [Ignavibacteriales bacterium]MCF8436604.1 TM2 domain-containing protein [Ignavibacteriales bacterium]
MANVLKVLPELIGYEQAFVSRIIKDMDDEKAQLFANAYRANRKDPQTILLLTLVGFLGIAGIQRFVVDQIGLGILYVLTGGICFIGTIIDLINYKNIAYEYNEKQAQQIASYVHNS